MLEFSQLLATDLAFSLSLPTALVEVVNVDEEDEASGALDSSVDASSLLLITVLLSYPCNSVDASGLSF